MPIGSPQWMYKSGEAFTIDQSLRFNDPDIDEDVYLTRSWTSSNTVATHSLWFKKSQMATNGQRFTTNSAGFYDTLKGDDTLFGYGATGGDEWRTVAKYRDPSAWYHYVKVVDSQHAAAADRVKVYINGVQQTLTFSGTSGQNNSEGFSSAGSQKIGIGFNGCLAEYHYIEGTAYAPSDFGEAGDYGEWKPIEVTGLTYGTNGFYLPFKQDYTVEGFSTVTWRGSGVANYIGGTGFQPDLTWIKQRDGTANHAVFDSVRGATKLLKANDTNAEATESGTLTAFNTDGFSLGTDSNQFCNMSGNTFVAWNWDMGGGGASTQHTVTANGATQHSTAQYKIGSSSILMDGTDDSLDIAASSNFDISGGNWTVEGWFRPDAFSSSQNHLAAIYLDSNDYLTFRFHNTHGLVVTHEGNGTQLELLKSSAIGDWSTGTWYHIAVVILGTNMKVYVNGTCDTSNFSGTLSVRGTSGNYKVQIGDSDTSTSIDEFDGYIDEFRVSDRAVYVADFTPQTTPFSDTEKGTVLLIHSDTTNGSTTFTDSSGTTTRTFSTNDDGDIDSYVAANTTYGQSIVSYTGNGTDNSTIGHGLSSAPEMIIIKKRNETDGWNTYHKDLTSGSEIFLNTTAAQADDVNNASWGDTHPSSVGSSTFTVGYAGDTNASGKTHIAYCFDSVAGYSSFGTYEGNDTSGNTITTGFPVAFVMIKRADGINNWNIIDNTRTPTGVSGKKVIRADEDAVEQTGAETEVELTATGFKLNNTQGEMNGSGRNYIYAAFADKREYAYWLDQSGNNNDWTSNNLTESDISVDSPTNNFATWNPLFRYHTGVNDTYSEGNLKVEDNSGFTVGVGTIPMTSGKWYWEVLCLRTSNSASDEYGMFDPELNFTSSANTTPADVGTGGYFYAGSGWTKANGTTTNNPGSQASVGAGDIIAFAYDVSAGTLKAYVNNILQKTITVAAQASYIPSVSNSHGSYSVDYVGNFGQDSSFAGNKTAQGNQDGNDIGDFYYEPPTDFLALCTSNLPAVAVTPSEHFTAEAWTGDGEQTRNITTGFQPDFAWVKNVNSGNDHVLNDVLRGFAAANTMRSNGTESETTYGSEAYGASVVYGWTDDVSSTSITVNKGTGDGSYVNKDTSTYVGWFWKAGGSGSANTDGNMAETVTVSANTDAGFSIVTYTGDGSAGTVGHGLSKAPEMVIVKSRSATGHWFVYHSGNTSAPETDRMILSTVNATDDDSAYWNDTAPTSSVFTVGTYAGINTDDDTMVAYCFHSVDGYSKVGSYIGNGNADGTFVYTGFRPAYLMVKHTTQSEAWTIWDTARDTYNQADLRLFANANTAETENALAVDILSNGFKFRHADASFNDSGDTFIYLAFAETPFKYSNAR